MGKGRLEAFSDGVLAIVITIMVLELRAPEGESLSALVPLVPVFLSYVLSFVYVAIYWTNHHHMFQMVHKISGPILWANLSLLFWLSLIPFVTAWMGENYLAATPTALYGVVMLMSGTAYSVLQFLIVASQGRDSRLKLAIGSAWKEKLSPALYLIAVPLAFVFPWVSQALFVSVALLWLVPDRRIEKALANEKA